MLLNPFAFRCLKKPILLNEFLVDFLTMNQAKMKLAKELETIFEILGRTIEMEYDMATG